MFGFELMTKLPDGLGSIGRTEPTQQAGDPLSTGGLADGEPVSGGLVGPGLDIDEQGQELPPRDGRLVHADRSDVGVVDRTDGTPGSIGPVGPVTHFVVPTHRRARCQLGRW